MRPLCFTLKENHVRLVYGLKIQRQQDVILFCLALFIRRYKQQQKKKTYVFRRYLAGEQKCHFMMPIPITFYKRIAVVNEGHV